MRDIRPDGKSKTVYVPAISDTPAPKVNWPKPAPHEVEPVCEHCGQPVVLNRFGTAVHADGS